MMKTEKSRVVFLDYLRVIACFMVILVHACEQFYFNDAGDFSVASKASAFWTVAIDSACRASVPLFVIASSFLLFPLSRPTGEFMKRRLSRVMIPFAIFACAYNWWNGGSWGAMAFNFPMATGGHLWFVPMLIGVYLAMILLSPWAEKVSERELRGWIIVWFFTTLFPYFRRVATALFGPPDFGAVSFLYGECPWNSFGAFHYVSGFFGYLLIGLWFRRFAPVWTSRQAIARATLCWVVGYAIVAIGFWSRIPFDGTFPLVRPYAFVVDLEMSWEFCSFGVAMTTLGYFIAIRAITLEGVFYRFAIRPLATASYGTYLVHIFFLSAIMPFMKNFFATPLAIVFGAIAIFASSSAFSLIVARIPFVGRFV